MFLLLEQLLHRFGNRAAVGTAGQLLRSDAHHLTHVGRRFGSHLFDNGFQSALQLDPAHLSRQETFEFGGFGQFVLGQFGTTAFGIDGGRLAALLDQLLDDFQHGAVGYRFGAVDGMSMRSWLRR